MTRMVLLLALVLMLSAISLVTVRFQARDLFVQAEQLKTREHDLEMQWRRLQLERAELERNARIDHIARTELGLNPVAPGNTTYVQRPAKAEAKP